ncbi:ATP-binding protein [Rhodococcus jostii]|uniref:HAMP domain-containing sensor histidine kinase n=1 Tax=Rhodococcus jostii TaxID=132919 RepID=UPI0036635BD3
MPGEHTSTHTRRWWRITQWPLLWKITVVLAVPLAVAVTLGGLRVHTALRDAAAFSEMAGGVQLLPHLVNLDNAAAVVAGTSAQRTVTDDLIDQLDSAITAVDESRATARLDRTTTDALDEALALSRTLSGQAKTGPPATEVLTGQRNTLRRELSTVVNTIVEPISDPEVAAKAGQLADMWAAQRTLFEQGMSVVELTSILRGESATAPVFEIWNFLATLRTESALVDAPAQHYPGDDPSIATIRTQITDRTGVLEAHLDRIPDQGTLDTLKQSLFTSVTAYTGTVTTTSAQLRDQISSKSAALRADAWRETALVSALLLGGIVVAAVVAVSLLNPLRRLRTGARRIAQRDLPAAVDRIKVGDDVDSATIRRIDVHTDEELGQLARAVDAIHDQALRLAGEQAHLRLQMRSMFETLARRNKSLVDLQLELIEKLEFEERDPKRLEHLFRLDHLAARLRRNGENLLILAGNRDHRTRLAPITMGDIVRAAISEVESYQRVRVTSVPAGALAGGVAVDLVHMLAELVDNSLRASPPDSAVTIAFTRTIEGGTVIDIVDTGIGISRGDLATINARLATRVDPTADTTRHMGLFVVGQLAIRHGMQVRLRPTEDIERNGGVTATVDVPARLLVSPAETGRPTPAAVAVEPRRTEHHAAPVPARRERPAASPPSPPVARDAHPSPVPVPPDREPSTGDGVSAESSPTEDSGAGKPTATSPSPRHLRAIAPPHPIPAPAPHEDEGAFTTPIYFDMVSEWLTDPATTPSPRPHREWVSPADSGWSAARHAAKATVDTVTESGLPQRVPGKRLVPGGLSGGPDARRRDPESIRASLTAHLSGVRDGRATGRL